MAKDRWAGARREAVRFPADLFEYPACPAPTALAEVMAAWLRDCCAEIDELREGLALARATAAARWRGRGVARSSVVTIP